MTRTEAERIRAEAARIIPALESGWPGPYTGPPFAVVTEAVRARHVEAALWLREHRDE